MTEKQQFIRRFGRPLYETFVYWLREDAVDDYYFDNIHFFLKTGGKHRKRAILRSLHQNHTKGVCRQALNMFPTKEALMAHTYAHREALGFYFDEDGVLHVGWRGKM